MWIIIGRGLSEKKPSDILEDREGLIDHRLIAKIMGGNRNHWTGQDQRER
jgi:hypothetical protein